MAKNMNKATHGNKNGCGPPIFRFKAQLFRDPKTAKTDSLTLEVPMVVSKKLTPGGTATVEGTINRHPFRAALEPNTSASHLLRVNNAMREGADADVGDTVELVILVPEPEPTVPPDLRVALTTSQPAKTFWKALTYMNRHDWVRWINAPKKAETRARRIALAVEWLSSGKRQPCCFNTYEYMLNCIYADGSRPKNLYPKSTARRRQTV